MIAVSLLMTLVVGAPCKADKDGFCTSNVVEAEIGYGAGRGPIRISCALGTVVSLRLPNGVELRGEPAFGNRAIFDLKVQRDPFRLLVWPKLPAGAKDVSTKRLVGKRSNLQIF